MLKKGFGIIVFCSIFALLLSCSDYNRVMKGKDYDAKFDMALKYYNKKNYYKAFPLFEELMTVYRGTAKAERTYYYYGYCNYYSGDYESAAFDFDNFVRTFPNSDFAEECAFMHAKCYYEDSPSYSLDQTSTVKAIEKLQLFADRYPQSSKLPDCSVMIDELRLKLEQKDYENAQLYFGTAYYTAAVTAFKNLINDYPSTRFREESLFMIFKAQYLLAGNSVETKKKSRMEQALVYYTDFTNVFPESKFRKEANNLADVLKKKLEKMATDNISLN